MSVCAFFFSLSQLEWATLKKALFLHNYIPVSETEIWLRWSSRSHWSGFRGSSEQAFLIRWKTLRHNLSLCKRVSNESMMFATDHYINSNNVFLSAREGPGFTCRKIYKQTVSIPPILPPTFFLWCADAGHSTPPLSPAQATSSHIQTSHPSRSLGETGRTRVTGEPVWWQPHL